MSEANQKCRRLSLGVPSPRVMENPFNAIDSLHGRVGFQSYNL
jgi:hypothetical protein